MLVADAIDSDDSADLQHLFARKLELERRRLDLVKRFGLLYYRPYNKQEAFHLAASYKHRMYRAGNRSGKSTMGAAEDCSWLLGYRPWYPENDPRRTVGIPQHANKGLVITNDWDKVKEIWTSEETGKIWRFLPDGFVIKTARNHSGAIDTIICANGSVLRWDTVESFKKSPMGSESSDFDFLHIDEPCPKAMYVANARGLIDRGGSDWFTLTPLSELWINDLFFPENAAEVNTSCWCEVGSTFDNPYLTAAGIAEFEKLITEDERQCRLHGLPLELAGLVYKEFKRDLHVLRDLPSGWTAWNNPPADHTIYCAIDPHPKTPHAVLFIAVGPHELPIIYDEIFIHTDIDQLADIIRSRLATRSFAPIKCDPIAWIEDPISGECFARRFEKGGLPVLKASKAKEFGILTLKSVLKQERGLRFVPTVHRTLFEIQRYCYDPKTNRPVDEDDHMMENLYRLMINTPCWCEDTTSLLGPITDTPIDSDPIHYSSDVVSFDMSLD